MKKRYADELTDDWAGFCYLWLLVGAHQATYGQPPDYKKTASFLAAGGFMTATRTYNDKVKEAFKIACGNSADGASATDVARVMKTKGWLSELDTVIDIADIMKDIGIAR